jgi:isoleucyl-tRNA synthetase
MDYKHTLNLPQTSFPMRANLPAREPEILARWESMGLYRAIQRANAGKPKFVLHDGPPYANGHVHLGTALNKILKDIIVRYKSMAGFHAPYVPGWDCHGLPIELQVERELATTQRTPEQVGKAEVRRLCRRYAERFVDIQRAEFRRLGVLGAWETPYLTMTATYEAVEVREFAKLVRAGYVYRGKKPVHWCASCVTALAEAEVEYDEIASPSIHVAFPLVPPFPAPLAALGDVPVALVIWTTTPWTLPANLAVAVHPDHEYVAVAHEGGALVVARARLGAVAAVAGLGTPRVLATMRGSALAGGTASHPWIDRRVPIVLADHVTLDTGTGCVHIAPGHGQEDYETGRRYGLDVLAPVDERGRFTSEAGELAGRRVFDADPAVIARLERAGRLLAAGEIRHSYPHCWRCKNPVLFRATEQWFVSLEHESLRRRALEEIERVQWIPAWGRDRIAGMIENRPDWCLSRQRAWGVPVVAFYCAACRAPVLSAEAAEHVAGIFERETSDAWFVRAAADLVPPGFACPRCGGGEFRREEDILDVWFDSGVSFAAVVERHPDLAPRADMYLEGTDQHRGWFHSALLTAVATRDRAPYAAVLTHGFTLDGAGRKMSKSLRNVIAPEEITARYGADILRLWVAAEDYREDLRMSTEILGRLVEAYRRIRNTLRFLLGALADFTPPADGSRPPLLELDRWILHRTQRLVDRCRRAFDAYEFHVVYHGVNNFCSVDLSALYLDIVKDRLYCSAAAAPERRAAQWTMWRIAETLTPLVAPILAFTAEDVWRHLPGERAESVSLAPFPEVETAFVDEELEAVWGRLFEMRAAVNKALEEARQADTIGHSLDAGVWLAPADPDSPAGREWSRLLDRYREALPTLCIVSQVEVGERADGVPPSPLLADLAIRVGRAAGAKCARCWNYRTSVGANPSHPDVCDRCHAVVSA